MNMTITSVEPNGQARSTISLDFNNMGSGNYTVSFTPTAVTACDDLGNVYPVVQWTASTMFLLPGEENGIALSVDGTVKPEARRWALLFPSLSGQSSVKVGYNLQGGH
jgi:hypothetical protein